VLVTFPIFMLVFCIMSSLPFIVSTDVMTPLPVIRCPR